jgi:cutinase
LNSQGAQVLHNAVAKLTPDVQSHIKAIVVFGDPDKGRPIKGISSSIILTECFANDNVCNGLPLPIGAHNEYYKKIDEATEWIVKTIGKS